ncbi:MAG: hypothetical protein ACRECR_00500 [Thermoplasmata archaeon]
MRVPPDRVLQWPLVGLAVFLALLILATPSLLGILDRRASSPETQPVLDLSLTPTGNGTVLSVEGFSQTTYARIEVGLASGFTWGITSDANLSWGDWMNRTNSSEVDETTSANPVAVNVTVEYIDSTGRAALYVGVYAFNSGGSSVLVQPLIASLGTGGPSKIPVADLPQVLALYLVGSAS